MAKNYDIEIYGPIAPSDLLEHDTWMRRCVEICRDDQAPDILGTAGTDRLRDRLARLAIELVPIRGDEAQRPSRGLSGTLIAPGRTILIWIDAEVYASPALLADALFHEAIHASARALRNHAFLPSDKLHPQEHVAEEIVALLGANLIARFVGFDLAPVARHNRQQAVRLHAKHLLEFD